MRQRRYRPRIKRMYRCQCLIINYQLLLFYFFYLTNRCCSILKKMISIVIVLFFYSKSRCCSMLKKKATMNCSNTINWLFVVYLLFNYAVMLRLTFNSTCFFNEKWYYRKRLCDCFWNHTIVDVRRRDFFS